ncbi:MAG: YceI family protein [Planctomycetia bacterium]
MIRAFSWRCGGWLPRALLAATVLAVAVPAAAQPPAPAVDLVASRVYVLVGKSGLVGHVHAVEGRLAAGQVALGVADRAGFLVFDMRTFLADTPAARRMLGVDGDVDASTQQQTNANMLGPEVLDVARHPTARFEIRSSLPTAQPRPNSPPAYDLVGTFTLHGATRPLTLVAEAEEGPAAVRLRGGFPIRQTDFGMKPYAKFGGVVGVADELKIWGDVLLPKAAPP